MGATDAADSHLISSRATAQHAVTGTSPRHTVSLAANTASRKRSSSLTVKPSATTHRAYPATGRRRELLLFWQRRKEMPRGCVSRPAARPIRQSQPPPGRLVRRTFVRPPSSAWSVFSGPKRNTASFLRSPSKTYSHVRVSAAVPFAGSPCHHIAHSPALRTAMPLRLSYFMCLSSCTYS